MPLCVCLCVLFISFCFVDSIQLDSLLYFFRVVSCTLNSTEWSACESVHVLRDFLTPTDSSAPFSTNTDRWCIYWHIQRTVWISDGFFFFFQLWFRICSLNFENIEQICAKNDFRVLQLLFWTYSLNFRWTFFFSSFFFLIFFSFLFLKVAI